MLIDNCLLIFLCLDPPVFVVRPQDLYQQLKAKDITMACSASGDPTPQITWRKVSISYGYHMDISWVSHGCHMDITWMSLGYHMGVTWLMV